MKTINRLSALCAVVILFAGCNIYHIKSEDITTDYYPSKKSTKDIVFLETVNKPHEVIGYVNVNTERVSRMSDIIEKMKKEAAVLGADGITNIKSDATGPWKALPAQEFIGNGYVRANFTATAFVFK